MRKRISVIVLAIIMFVSVLPLPNFNKIVVAEETSINITDEWWDSTNNIFKKEVVEYWLRALTITTEDTDINNITNYVDRLQDLAIKKSSYKDWYSILMREDTTGTVLKIPITIGGLTWLPMYLSLDRNNNVILTMWLSDCYQSEWVEKGSVNVDTEGYALLEEGSLYANFGIDETGENSKHMYSTSMVRAYGLNNPSEHVYVGVDAEGVPQYESYTQNENHPFALFTQNEAFKKYMVTPSQVIWQEYQSTGVETTDMPNPMESLNALEYVIKNNEALYNKTVANEYNVEYVNIYANTIMNNVLSAVNDSWSENIVTQENQVLIYDIIDIMIEYLEYEIANATEEQKPYLEEELASVNTMVESLSPYIAVDPYGNYHNLYNNGGINNQSEPYNSEWKNDYLWLPSSSELLSKEEGGGGIWEVDTNLMVNTNQATGSTYNGGTLFRSAISSGVLNCSQDGTSYGMATQVDKCGIRPAFHLNISKLIEELGLEESGSNCIYVGELWDSNSQQINQVNLQKMYNAITGLQNSSIQLVTELLNNNNNRLTSQDIRNNNSGKNVVVTIGGYEWFVTYLSFDKEGKPIVTLWANNSFQKPLAHSKKLYIDPYAANINGSLLSMLQTGSYGDSSLRGMALNQESSIFVGTSDDANETILASNGYYTYTPTYSHPLSLFTMESLGFTKYITTPENVGWQEFQNAKDYLSDGSSFGNEAWSNEIKHGENNFDFTDNSNFAELDASNNSKWATDYLWIPSVTETMIHIETDVSYHGLWEVNTSQTSNYDGVTDSVSMSVGNYMTVDIPTSPTLRTVFGSESADNLFYVGIYSDGTGIQSVNTYTLVRPAMHLSLSEMPDVLGPGLHIVTPRGIYSGSSHLSNISFVLDSAKVATTGYELSFYKDGVEVFDVVDVGEYTIKFTGLTSELSTYQDVEFLYYVDPIDITYKATVYVGEIPAYEEGVTTAVEPEIIVSYNGATLVNGVDYDVTYANNTSPTALATYTITYKGKYQGSNSGTFMIKGIDLSLVSTYINGIEYSYECDLVTVHKYYPTSVKAEGVLLVYGVDYECYFLDAEGNMDTTNSLPDSYFQNPGTIRFVVVGINNYKGQITDSYFIDQIDIKKASIIIPNEERIYNGNAFEPVPTVKYGEVELIYDEDYYVTYYDNINAGYGVIRIDFKGRFEGYLNTTFVISPLDISTAALAEEIPDYTFSGEIYVPEYSLVCNGIVIPDTSITADRLSVKDAGTYTFKCTGKGNFTGTYQFTVTVLQAHVSNIKLNINSFNVPGGDTTKAYYGQVSFHNNLSGREMCVVDVYAIIDGQEKKIDSYSMHARDTFTALRDNEVTTDFESVGVIVFQYTALDSNNYYLDQMIACRFTIVPDITTSIIVPEDNYRYVNREYIGYAIITMRINENLVRDEDYALEFYKYDDSLGDYSTTPLSAMIDAGTYKWQIRMLKSYYSIDPASLPAKQTITIIPYDIAGATTTYYYTDSDGNYTDSEGTIVDSYVEVSPSSGKYTGLKLSAKIYDYDYNNVFYPMGEVSAEYYSVAFDDSTKADGYCTVTITATHSNVTGTIVQEFSINQYLLKNMELSGEIDYVYNYGNAVTLDFDVFKIYNTELSTYLTLGTDFDYYAGTVTIGDEEVEIDGYYNNINVGTAYVCFEGLGDYIGKLLLSFEITELDLTTIKENFSLSKTTVYFTNQYHYPAVSHSILQNGEHFITEYSDNKDVGTGIVTIKGIDNCLGEFNLNFRIARKSILDSDIIISGPLASYEYEGVSLDHIESDISLLYSQGENSYILTKDVDYIIRYYRDGANTMDPYSVGEVTVKVEGITSFINSTTFTYLVTAKNISSGALGQVLSSTYTYKAGLKVGVNLSYKGVALVENRDYTIEYSRNGVSTTDTSSVGQVDYSLQGKGNFQGNVVGSFTIEKGVLHHFSKNEYNYKYNRKVQRPTPLDVYDNGGNVVDTEEYIITYYKYDDGTSQYVVIDELDMDFTTPGNYKIEANVNPAKDNYTGSCVAIYYIEKMSIAEILGLEEVQNLFENKEYTNSDIRQEVEIIFGDYGLVEGEDYEIIYDNNKDVGEVGVEIVGKGNYTGNINTSFEITEKPVDEIVDETTGEVLANLVVHKPYTGQNVSLDEDDLARLIKYGDGYLEPNVDFTYEYQDAERVEMGDYLVTLTGIGNYKSTATITLRVGAIDISTSMEILPIADQTYIGEAITPALSFKVNGADATLTQGVDYSVVYANNTSVGIATITVTGMGLYAGTKQTTFNIVSANISDTDKFTYTYTSEHTYTSASIDTSFTVKYKYSAQNVENTLVNTLDYTSSVYADTNNNSQYDVGVDTLVDSVINAGKYFIVVVGANNYTGTHTLTVNVLALNITTAISEELVSINGVLDSYVYTGLSITPLVSVVSSVDITSNFTITYGENILVADGGKVFVTANANTNFVGTVTLNFVITKANIVVEVGLVDGSVEYYIGDSLPQIEVKNTVSVLGTLAYANLSQTLLEGTNSYSWTYTPQDSANYNIAIGSVSITAVARPVPPAVDDGNNDTTDTDADTKDKDSNNFNILLILIIVFVLLILILVVNIIINIRKHNKLKSKRNSRLQIRR